MYKGSQGAWNRKSEAGIVSENANLWLSSSQDICRMPQTQGACQGDPPPPVLGRGPTRPNVLLFRPETCADFSKDIQSVRGRAWAVAGAQGSSPESPPTPGALRMTRSGNNSKTCFKKKTQAGLSFLSVSCFRKDLLGAIREEWIYKTRHFPVSF